MPHIHELYDFVVTFLIVYDGKALLVNHPRYGMWIPPGGHIELDEDPDTALVREIQEETGLEVEIISPKPLVANSPDVRFLYTPEYVEVHDANPPHRHIAMTYFARAKHGNHVLSDEHTEIKWFTPDELEETKYNINPSVKFLANEAIKAEHVRRQS